VTTDPVFYTVFTRRKQNDRYIFSPGVSAQLWHTDAGSLRQWVPKITREVKALEGLMSDAMPSSSVVDIGRRSGSGIAPDRRAL
jgi:hypothetical protein